jgi:charged multivesicular body protein 2A
MAPKPPPRTQQQMVRDNQRLLQKSIREIEKEKSALDVQEKRIVADIKKV